MSDEIDRFLEAYPPDIRDLTHEARGAEGKGAD